MAHRLQGLQGVTSATRQTAVGCQHFQGLWERLSLWVPRFLWRGTLVLTCLFMWLLLPFRLFHAIAKTGPAAGTRAARHVERAVSSCCVCRGRWRWPRSARRQHRGSGVSQLAWGVLTASCSCREAPRAPQRQREHLRSRTRRRIQLKINPAGWLLVSVSLGSHSSWTRFAAWAHKRSVQHQRHGD